MRKLYLIVAGAVGVVVIVLVASYVKTGSFSVPGWTAQVPEVVSPDGANESYLIAEETVPLAGGEATVQVEQGVFVQYKLFQQADGLLNEDLTVDAGVLLVGDAGGSGTFYYAAALVSTASSGWQGTEGILLGDRIAPQTIDVSDDMFIVNYAERKPGEPFTAEPSVAVTKYFQVRNGEFVEITPKE